LIHEVRQEAKPVKESEKNMELNIEKIEQAIIDQAVDSLISERGISDLVSTMVTRRIDEIFTSTCEAKIEEAIQLAIKSGFEREYVKVNSFGQESGHPTTLGKELDRMVSTYWETRVDAAGRPADGYSAKMTRAEFVMGKIMAEDFNASIKQMIVNAGGALKDALRVSLNGSVNEALSSVLRVNSLGDQGQKRTGSACVDPKSA
jgi:hypothetical protein